VKKLLWAKKGDRFVLVVSDRLYNSSRISTEIAIETMSVGQQVGKMKG
jgi:hypothetical protein